MGIQKQVRIDQVLVFQSGDNSRDLGRALWAALEEVSRYFTCTPTDGWLEVPLATKSGSVGLIRAEFRKWYVAPELPPDFREEVEATGSYVSIDPGGKDTLWTGAEQSPSIYDHRKLGTAVASMLELESAAILIDQEIDPPSEWRYIVWDWYFGGAVISFAPIDPHYWGIGEAVDDQARVQEIKRGARAACMSVTGSILGLSRCDNPRCFMFGGVDSVSGLSDMLSLGPEHQVTGLARGRFDEYDQDPNVVSTPVPESAEAS